MPTWRNLKRHRYQAASTLDFKRQWEISYTEEKRILAREISEHNWEISNEPLLQKDFVQFQDLWKFLHPNFQQWSLNFWEWLTHLETMRFPLSEGISDFWTPAQTWWDSGLQSRFLYHCSYTGFREFVTGTPHPAHIMPQIPVIFP